MKRRKPQARCKCGHAKSKHQYITIDGLINKACGYCYTDCLEFQQDNLTTLERLNAFKEQKEEENCSNVSL